MRSLINLERLGPKFWWLEQPSTTSQVCRSWEFQAWILGFIESDLPQRIERSHRELRMGISTNIRFWRTSFRFSCFLPTLRGVERFCFGVRKENKQQENKKWIYWRWHKTTVAHRGLVDSRWSNQIFSFHVLLVKLDSHHFVPPKRQCAWMVYKGFTVPRLIGPVGQVCQVVAPNAICIWWFGDSKARFWYRFFCLQLSIIWE